jgi:hypothetical protein
MATRSRIGIVNEDGTVSSIYCHFDGYVSGVGKKLVENYTNRDKVKELISLGSISSLGERVSPDDPLKGYEEGKAKSILERFNPKEKHSFDNPAPGVTVAYHRDRGEEYFGPRVNESLDDYLLDDNEEYGYVFTLESEWLVKPWSKEDPVQPVNEVLAEDT